MILPWIGQGRARQSRVSKQMPFITTHERNVMIKRPLIGLAILIATAAVVLTGCGSSGSQTSSLDTTSANATATIAAAADTGAGASTSDLGQGVEQTCQDLVGFFTLAKDADLAHGGQSVSDIEQAVAAASALASQAPAEPSTSFMSGEPRESLQSIANSYQTYLDALPTSGLEPGPDALLDPSIASAMEDASIDVSVGLIPWIDARCSADVHAQLQELAG
jgi:hypothetical protein